jgi:hypothetical protein
LKLLLDEMWPQSIAEELRRRGHDVNSVAERPDLRGQPDEVIFAVARAERRAIVTENVGDYRPLAVAELQTGRHFAGMLFTSNRSFPRGDPRTVGRLVSVLEALLSAPTELEGIERWLP